MHSKKLEFEKLKNVRDLCSIKNKDGFNIKENKLIRGIRLADGSESDLKKLYEQHDVRMIIDLRTSVEKYEKKDGLYKDERYFDISVQKESYVGVSMDQESQRKKAYFEKLDKMMKDKDFMLKHMSNFYYSLANDYTSQQYGKFLNLVLDNDHATYWHCSLGRDRCGIATALLLECLDVDRDTIIEDYLYTNQCADYTDLAYREYIEAYYRGVEDVYGGVDNLLEFIGVDKNKKALFKEKYLEK